MKIKIYKNDYFKYIQLILTNYIIITFFMFFNYMMYYVIIYFLVLIMYLLILINFTTQLQSVAMCKVY